MSGYVRAYEGSEPYLFVSYAHKDSRAVIPVIHELHSKKYRVWYDEGIAPGSEWPHNIATHLERASAVIVFASKNYIASPNCQNEARVAEGQDKKKIQISLDDSGRRPLFSDALLLAYDENLTGRLTDGNLIGGEFIGDGVTGYRYSIEKKRSFNKWNLLLAAAAALAVVFSVSLYGLYVGWFDSLLPSADPPPPPPPTASQEGVSVENSLLGSVLPVAFSSDEEKAAVYEMLSWAEPFEMTYEDLGKMDGVTELEIGNGPISNLRFTAFLPNLERLRLAGSQITDLTPLIECPHLKTVTVNPGILPLQLPEGRLFEVEVN